jgi:hypothetical protein
MRKRYFVLLVLVQLTLPGLAQVAVHGVCERRIAAESKARFNENTTMVNWSFEKQSRWILRVEVFVSGVWRRLPAGSALMTYM